MARPTRKDEPGSWHHVMNRAIARRTLFEDRADVRFFLSRLARQVRARRLEVHAWSVMTTHFHLLVRSPRGKLSEAVRQVQNQYVKHFNRRHRRDGTLIRGRFLSKPVTTETYQRVLMRYIDENPVVAGIVTEPWLYPWGSAVRFSRERRRRWRTWTWVESVIEEARGEGETFGHAYMVRSRKPLGVDARRWIEERMAFAGSSPRDLDDLVNGAPEHVVARMRRRAAVADGHAVGEPVKSLRTVDDTAVELGRSLGRVGDKGRPIEAHWVFRVSMCRLLASGTWQEIALQTGRNASTCASAFQRHLTRLLEEHPPYREAALHAAREVLLKLSREAEAQPRCAR